MHAAKLPVVVPGPSSLHWNVAVPSGELRPKVGDATLVGPVGPPMIVVSGGVVSTVHM